MTVHIQQFKGMQSSKQGLWKGNLLSIEGIRKGYLVHGKMVFQRVRGWTSGRSLPVWKFVEYAQTTPPPLPRRGLLHVFLNFPRVWFIACLIAVFGMLLGDTLILDDLDCANKYRQQVSTLVVNAFKGDVTRGDSQQRFLAQHGVAKLLQHWFKWLQQCSNIAGNAVSRLAVSGS